MATTSGSGPIKAIRLDRQRVDGADPPRFERGDLGLLLLNVAEFVDAFTRQCLENASTGNSTTRPLGVVSVCFGRSIFTVGVRVAGGEQLRVHVRRHHDRQQRVLQRVLLEDVGEATC